jgi:hypothetical protein
MSLGTSISAAKARDIGLSPLSAHFIRPMKSTAFLDLLYTLADENQGQEYFHATEEVAA